MSPGCRDHIDLLRPFLVKNTQRSKTVKVCSNVLPKREKRLNGASTFDKTAFCQKLSPEKSRNWRIPAHLKA
jgi:hypothetical protein